MRDRDIMPGVLVTLANVVDEPLYCGVISGVRMVDGNPDQIFVTAFWRCEEKVLDAPCCDEVFTTSHLVIGRGLGWDQLRATTRDDRLHVDAEEGDGLYDALLGKLELHDYAAYRAYRLRQKLIIYVDQWNDAAGSILSAIDYLRDATEELPGSLLPENVDVDTLESAASWLDSIDEDAIRLKLVKDYLR